MSIAAILITNGGAHPPDVWAELTANTIVDTVLVDSNPNDSSDAAITARMAKRRLRADLFDILLVHHTDVQASERAECAKVKKTQDAAARAVGAHDPSQHNSMVDLVVAAAAGTPFAEHFAKPEVRDLLWQIIGQHTVNVMHIERRMHLDRLSGVKGA